MNELRVHDDWFPTFGFGPRVQPIDRSQREVGELDVSSLGDGRSWTLGLSRERGRPLALEAESLRLFGFELP